MNGQGVRYATAYSGKDQENLHELYQLFPTADKKFVVQTYEAKKRNFEATFKAIDQSIKYNQEINALQRVPPERKLAFLRLAFDKLNPDWIRMILQRYNWSVEMSLDDILRAEEERTKAVEEQRRKEEEARMKREEAERAIIEQRRIENERHNVVIFMQSMFPNLPPALVADVVSRCGFNPDAAAAQLAQHEQQRLAHEREIQRQREEQLMREQEARRAAEIKAIEDQLRREEIKLQEKLPTLLQCQNWDQVAQVVLQQPDQGQAAHADERQEAIIRAAVKATPKVDPKKVSQIVKENNYDIDASLLLLRAQEFNDAFQQMLTVFPDLSKEQIQDALTAAFPDSGKAMQDLQPIANDLSEERLLRQAIQNETRFLAESKAALTAWETEKSQMMSRRAERRRQLAEAKTPEEKGFMQMVDEMQSQKEDIEIKTNDEKLRLDIASRESKISLLQDKLEQLLGRRQERANMKASVSLVSAADDIKARKAEFEKYVNQENQKIDNLRDDSAQKRQSMVARRLREQIGEERFSQLQNAIGRAPGGFSVGTESASSSNSGSRAPADALPGIIAAQVRQRSRLSMYGAQPAPDTSAISGSRPVSSPAVSASSSSSNTPVGSLPSRSPSQPQSVSSGVAHSHTQELRQREPTAPPAQPQPTQQAQAQQVALNPFHPTNPFAPTNPFVPEQPSFPSVSLSPSASVPAPAPPRPQQYQLPSYTQQQQLQLQQQQHQQQLAQSLGQMNIGGPQSSPMSPQQTPQAQQYPGAYSQMIAQPPVAQQQQSRPAVGQLVGSYAPQPQPPVGPVYQQTGPQQQQYSYYGSIPQQQQQQPLAGSYAYPVQGQPYAVQQPQYQYQQQGAAQQYYQAYGQPMNAQPYVQYQQPQHHQQQPNPYAFPSPGPK